MSEFGFDTFALGGGGAGAPSHPLEIARELIASGQAREALDVLSEHHDALVDDPDYLLACSEAWWAEGDSLRAQQALLGAARLAPEDPTPLVLLAELFRQEGELDKAERVLQRAEALGEAPRLSIPDEASLEPPRYDDDLIAAAELKERRTRAGLTPRQIAVAVAGLLFVCGFVFGIAKLTDTDAGPEAPPVETVAVPGPTAIEPAAPEPAVVAPAAVEPEAAAPAAPEPEAVEPPPVRVEPAALEGPPAIAAPIAPSLPEVPTIAVRESKPAVKKTERVEKETKGQQGKEAKKTKAVAPSPSPSAPLLSLQSDDKEALTRQGDSLYAQGQTGLASTYYRRALEVDGDYAPALVGIGRGILRAEKYDEAFGNATRALELARGVDSRPGLEAEAIYQLGRVHLHRGDLDAARRLFRQSISLPRAPAEAWFYLGEALWNDNSPAARTAYEAYLERVPNGHLAERARRAIQ